MATNTRLLLACATASAWLALLLSGHALGGAVHLLLVAGLALFPWRAAAGSESGEAQGSGSSAGSSDPSSSRSSTGSRP